MKLTDSTTRSPDAFLRDAGIEERVRKKYAPPVLREFGSVGELTQAGSAGLAEGNPGMGGMMGGSNNPNRRL